MIGVIHAPYSSVSGWCTVNKQRSIDEIGYARRLEVQQAMAERKDHIDHPQPKHHGDHRFRFIHPAVAGAVLLVQPVGDKSQQRRCAAPW